MRCLCVFCGSHPGRRSAYRDAARALGRELAGRRIELAYGGGRVGLMGELADAVLEAGGRVTGVIPRFMLDRELGHPGLSALEVVESMHERKARLAELADGFVALPGGLGTVEEISEIVTWAQLGLHAKPCGLLDVEGFFAPLLAFLDRTVAEGFVRADHRGLLISEREPGALLDRLAAFVPSVAPKWIERT